MTKLKHVILHGIENIIALLIDMTFLESL